MKKADSEATAGGQINTIVFLTVRPVSAFEAEKWSFGYLHSQDFEVKVFDISKLLHKARNASTLVINSVLEPLQGDFIHRVDSYGELEILVKKFSANSLFIDYLVGVSAVTLKEEKIFRLLKKYNSQYSFLSSGALPLSSSLATNMSGKLQVFQSKVVRAIANPYKLLNYLASKVILFLTRHRIAYPLPAVIFGGHSEVLQHYVEARNFYKTKIVPIHSSDYDSSIVFLRGFGNKLPPCEDLCVFLDEAATHHSDFSILGIEPAAAKLYFEAMNHFFDFVKKTTGLKVVIAAHPRSNYESMPGVFGERAVIKGKTVELVAKSKLVVMHMSTSLSYAVLFKKPVIPVKIPGMRVNSQLNLMVETMGAAIGSKPIDIVKDELTASLLQRECNLEKYLEYKEHYVKTAEADELPGWEIVAKYAKSIKLNNGLV
jgi:hypothetical protein